MKRMGKLLLILLLLVSISCRSTKSVEKAVVKTNVVEKKDISTTDNKTLQATSLQKTADKTTVCDSTSETKTEIELSKPDSTGKQYPTKITYTDRLGKRTVKKDVAVDKNNTILATSVQEKLDKSKTNASNKSKTSSTEEKTSNVKWHAIILFLVLVIVVAVLTYIKRLIIL